VKEGVTEGSVRAGREARDATLAMPRLIIPSLQVNMRAGDLPKPDEVGNAFLKVPVNGCERPLSSGRAPTENPNWEERS
jgi:hypothetical protein